MIRCYACPQIQLILLVDAQGSLVVELRAHPINRLVQP